MASPLQNYLSPLPSKCNGRTPSRQLVKVKGTQPDYKPTESFSDFKMKCSNVSWAKFSGLNIQKSQPGYLSLASKHSQEGSTSPHVSVGLGRGGVDAYNSAMVFRERQDLQLCAYPQLPGVPPWRRNPKRLWAGLWERKVTEHTSPMVCLPVPSPHPPHPNKGCFSYMKQNLLILRRQTPSFAFLTSD